MAVRNAADPEQVKEADQRVKRGREQETADFRAVMETAQGRRFMARMLDMCRWQKMSYVAGDPGETALNEGKRSIALILWGEINESCSDLYETMVKELKEKADA